jgi:putative addiction module component (TIGR02574 family)
MPHTLSAELTKLSPAPRFCHGIAELRLLPNSEKLKIIETLWADLSADEASFESPAWHADELRKTEEDLKAGRVTAVDWDEAKKALRKRFE